MNLHRPLQLSDLVGETIILSRVHDRPPSYLPLLTDAFKQRQLPFPEIREEGDLQFAIGLVAAGEGISIVPSSYKKIRFNVVYHSLEDPSLAASINMHFRKGDSSPIITSLLSIIYDLYDHDAITHTKESLTNLVS